MTPTRIELGQVTLTYDPQEGRMNVLGIQSGDLGMLSGDWDRLRERFRGIRAEDRALIGQGVRLLDWINRKAHRNYTDQRAAMWKERKAS